MIPERHVMDGCGRRLAALALIAAASTLAPGHVARAVETPHDSPSDDPCENHWQAANATSGFEVEDDLARNTLALALLPCLAHPDPRLRDRLAFEALSAWLGADALTAATRQSMSNFLLPQLAHRDDEGFAAPFAALVLADLAARERRSPSPQVEEMPAWAGAAADYLRGVDDYRGFDEHEGWRHGVAHGADLVMQLAQHPALTRTQLDMMAAAVAAQVAPSGHSYVFGEPQRLARALYFIARRGMHSQSDWQAYLDALTDPAPLPDWNAAFASAEGLVRRHNTLAFLDRLYVWVQEGGDEDTAQRLLPGLRSALRRLR